MDLIDRQAAIDAMRQLEEDDIEMFVCPIPEEFDSDRAIEALKELPSVQPRKGMWCMTPDGKLVCSCCYENPTNRIIVNGDLIYDMTPIRKRMKFCPNCGADMRGEDDER